MAFIPGTTGNDILRGSDDNDILNGIGGNDTLAGGNGDDTLLGGDGNDLLEGGNGNDDLVGGAGTDSLNGGNGNDTLNGSVGTHTLNGSFGNDTYIVDGSDVVVEEAGGGVDTVLASVSYTLGTNLENLTLTGVGAINGTGNAQSNLINGNTANNVLNGGEGNDTINGAAGNDSLNGGNGNDLVNGGSGTDTLIGGLGNDTFDFDSVLDSQPGLLRDVINDFFGNGISAGDQIDLSTIDANSSTSSINEAFTFIGSSQFNATGQLRYAGGILQASTDADIAAEFEVQLLGSPTLVVNDIIL